MTQEPFTHAPAGQSGAVDFSTLGQESAGNGLSAAYSVQVTEENFQSLLESSMSAPVLLVLYSGRLPETVRLANDLQALSVEFEGRFLLGRVDVDTEAGIAQAMQAPSVPLVALVVQGRPMPLFQDAPPKDTIRATLQQVLQQLAGQGFAGRHQPRAAGGTDEDGEPQLDPRYVPAQDALERSDYAGAIAEYQKLLDANSADHEAAAGLAMATLLQRVQGVDLQAARQAAADNPDDVAAQTLVADLDLYGGHVEDAFGRLIELVRRTTEEDRDAARAHLIGLFAAVGDDDPRVLKARRALASALF